MTDDADETARPPLIGALLRMPVDAVGDRLLAGVHGDGFTDLNAAHLPLLRWPGPDRRRPSDLAGELRMTKQAVNYQLGELERMGYLTRRPDPEDRRSTRIGLTERGEALVLTIRRVVRSIEAEWERDLGAERFATLRELLVALNATPMVRAIHGPHRHPSASYSALQSDGAPGGR